MMDLFAYAAHANKTESPGNQSSQLPKVSLDRKSINTLMMGPFAKANKAELPEASYLM